MATKTLTKKRTEQAKLHTAQTMTLTITVETSEINMQRLAALMLLQDPTKVVPEIVDLGPLPWEGTPADENPPPLELDHNLVRNEIMRVLTPFITKRSTQDAKVLLTKHGGQSLKTVPEQNLLALLRDIEAGCE